jgi:hypothetical protein
MLAARRIGRAGAFDLAGITNTAGCPILARFCARVGFHVSMELGILQSDCFNLLVNRGQTERPILGE